MRRYAARTDANHAIICSAFRALHCTVLDLSSMGEGCPDICVGVGGISMLVEIKDGSKPPSKRKLNKRQQEWRDTWTGGMRIVESIDDVAATVRVLRNWHNKIVG